MGLHRAPSFGRRAGLWYGQQPEWLLLDHLVLFLHELDPCRIGVALALLVFRQRYMGLADVSMRRVELL
jgi:hypothetical protein